jgi:hypothetical protein
MERDIPCVRPFRSEDKSVLDYMDVWSCCSYAFGPLFIKFECDQDVILNEMSEVFLFRVSAN